MVSSRYEFFECNNPDCRLRFPAYAGYNHSRRCPICRTSLSIASEVMLESERENTINLPDCPCVALLDNIRSAWNVGSIFRTADGIGLKKLYLCGITPTPDNYKVRKTALGGEASIAWEKCNNGVELVKKLKEQGYAIWTIEDLPTSTSLYQTDVQGKNQPLAIAFGNEVCGVDPGIIELSDKVLSIPMLGMKNSYNVAVAFGIAGSFLLYRQMAAQGSFRILPNT